MPSAIAHAVAGAALASTLPRESRPPAFVIGLALLAAAPDLDVLAFQIGIPYGHPLGHRGLSHSLFLAAFLGLLSLILWRRLQPGRAALAAGVSFLAIASHGLLDTLTDGGLGIGLLLPFDDQRYFAPWRPILTSPLSITAFFSERGLTILASEALWVGLPSLALAAAAVVLRRVRSAREGPLAATGALGGDDAS